MSQAVFDPQLAKAPDSLLAEALHIGFEIDPKTINALSTLSQCVEMEGSQPVFVGQRKLQALTSKYALSVIFTVCPQSFSFKVIEVFKLNELPELDYAIAQIKSDAQERSKAA